MTAFDDPITVTSAATLRVTRLEHWRQTCYLDLARGCGG